MRPKSLGATALFPIGSWRGSSQPASSDRHRGASAATWGKKPLRISVVPHETESTGGRAIDASHRARAIEDALREGLGAEHIAVVDQSSLHAGHVGAEGGGHFQVVVVSERFRGLSRVAAQRLVYAALGELMVDEIHALSMRTLTPEEWSGLSSS